MGYLLGIDLGTSSVRVCVVSEEGVLVSIAQTEYPINTPKDGWAEQSPETWWKAVCKTIAGALSRGVKPDDISVIGLSGQMHGLVLVDRNGKPVRSAIIWPDSRSQQECREIEEQIGNKRLYEITGLPTTTGFLGPSLVWVQKNEPFLYEKSWKAILPKDYIRLKLVGEIGSDCSDASGTLLLDVRRREWSEEIVTKLNLRWDLLPKLTESTKLVGEVTQKAAEETGLRRGTLVAAGGSDQAMGAIGNGTIGEGIVAATIGTGGQVITASSRPIIDTGCRIHTLCHAFEGGWLLMGAVLAAGLSFRWFKENLIDAELFSSRFPEMSPYEFMSREAESTLPGSDGLVFLPYLVGERTPHMDPNARACFIGLGLSHTRAHMIRAVMEGVAYSMKESLEIFKELGVSPSRVILSGGGAKSTTWRQIQADIYRLPGVVTDTEEHSVLGAALTAGVAAGTFSSIREASRAAVRMVDEVLPLEQNAAIYDSGYASFRKLYPALKAYFADRKNSREGST